MKGLWIFLVSSLLVAALVNGDESNRKADILKKISDILKDIESTTEVVKDNDNGVKETDDFNSLLSTEIEMEDLDTPSNEPPCKNVDRDDKCFEESKKGLCKNSDVKKRCPRTCMACCADFNAQRCKQIGKFCFSTRWIARMKHLCPKTCSYCGKKAPAPPPCLSSTFGCCWDKSTAASAPIGSGAEKCPPCKNIRSDAFCSRFKSDCMDFRRLKGKQMRHNCAKTCRLCGANPICFDNPSQQESCPGYKTQGLCESSPNSMRFWCPKTCGLCSCNDNPQANCEFWKRHKACEQYASEMKVWCPFTCGYCKKSKTIVSGNSVESFI